MNLLTLSLSERRALAQQIQETKDVKVCKRPPAKSAGIFRELDPLLRQSPRQYGYHHVEWTAPVLAKVLKREHHLDISTQTLRRCVQQFHDVWKRPAYALARQSTTWAQEKGGSREGPISVQDVSCSSWMKPS